jgi:hypothetical protein
MSNLNGRKNAPPDRPARAGVRAARKTRLRYGTFPKPADRIEVPYAQCRESHRGRSYGQQTRRIINGAVWQEIMVPILDEIDRKRGRQALYSAHELESCLLFQRVAGEKGYKAARALLAGDEHRDARRLLGLDRPRGKATRGNPERWRRSGVPSRSTISRFVNEDFPREQRNAAYAAMVRRLREIIAPQLGDQARTIFMDGTKIETHYTAPKYDPRTGRMVNERSVTCPDAGHVPHSAHPDKAGDGWTAVWAGTETGCRSRTRWSS